jgi:Phosphoesterase family/Calx-beta domain
VHVRRAKVISVARRPHWFAAVLVCGLVAGSAVVLTRSRPDAAAVPLPVVSLPRATVGQVEGNAGTTTVAITASLSEPASSTVTVNYATVDGTAKLADSDYVAASGTLSFAPGSTSETISVSVVGDTKLEDYQTFGIKIAAPLNAKLGYATGHVEIRNDDKPQLAMAKAKSVVEGQAAVFKPHLVQRYYQPITLNAQTADATATAPGDYTALNAGITFAAGSKSPIPTGIPTIPDTTPEGTERFSLAISGAGVVKSVTRTATISGTCIASAPPATYQHVVIIVMENKTYGDVIGNAAAPFQTALSRACATATHYAQAASPSRPNYIAMTSGSTFGCEGSNADPPGGCIPPSPSLFQQVLDGGGSVRSYVESMSSNCETTSHGLYAVKHNPWPYYAAEAAVCAQFDQPMPGTLDVNNLPTLTYLVPNLCNDTHDCSVATGDQWLQTRLAPILDSAAFQNGSTALIISYDEYTNLPNVFASRSVRPGTAVTANTSHYGLLRTLEDMLGLAPLGQAATATSLRSATHL